jgi:hypothetical protein
VPPELRSSIVPLLVALLTIPMKYVEPLVRPAVPPERLML